MAGSSVYINIIGTDQVSDKLRTIRKEFDGLSSSSGWKNIMNGVGVGLGVAVFNGIAGAISGAANALTGMIGGAISKAGEMERFSTQLEVLLGSAEAADARLKELTAFAAKTPFELPGVIAASRTLQIFTQGVLATGEGLTLVGDIAAGTGQEFQGVAMWVGRLYDAMQSGRPFGEAAMRLQEMGALSGDARTRLEALAKAVKSGAISMADAWKIVTKEFSQFSGLMDKQSRTLEGMLSNLSDQIGQSLAGIGKELLPIAKAVIPVIMGMVKDAGNAVAGFIRDNYIMIRNWVVGIVSFLGGLVSAVFGQTNAVTKLTTAVASSTPVLDKNIEKVKEHTGASGSNTAALEKQIKKVDALTDSVKKLDEAQDKQFRKELERLTGAVDVQIDAIEAADRQRAIDEQRAARVRDIAEAEAALQKVMAEGGDANAALERLSDARAAAAEFERDQADEARKTELSAVKSFIQKIATAEGEWADKKKFLEQLKAQEAVLQSDIATAKQTGNLQKVADLTLELEAVKAAEVRAQQIIANEAQTRQYEKQKERLTKLKEAASASASGMTAAFTTAGANITDVFGGVETSLVGNIGSISAALGGRGQNAHRRGGGGRDSSLIAVMADARQAGIEFGEQMVKWLGNIQAAIPGLIGALNGLYGLVKDITTAVGTLTSAIGIVTGQGVRDLVGLPGTVQGTLDRLTTPIPSPKGGVPPGVSGSSGTTTKTGTTTTKTGTTTTNVAVASQATNIQRLMPAYAEGGIVSGPIGAPQMAIVHGGEQVIPVGRGGPITIVMQLNGRELGRAVLEELDFRRGRGTFLPA